VSYQLDRGEVLGIVGESGSGKSVTSLAMMGLLAGSARVSGSVRLHATQLVGAWGCRFRTRCPLFATHLTDAQRHRCTEEIPPLITHHHPTACHYTELSTFPALSGLSVVIGDDVPRAARAMRGKEG
jgi:ABC-type oligopeptide transport system ATPase subunit